MNFKLLKTRCKHCVLPFAFISLLTSCRQVNQEDSFVESTPCPTQGMVVTAHPLATEIGLQVLKDGGNSFDAAIAVQFALSVVYPRAGNIGGGGFLVYRDSHKKQGALNFRETAPGLSYEDMYLDDLGNVIPRASTAGHLSVGVPGVVDGMVEIHKKYGTIEWEKLIQPAIDLAINGYPLTEKEAKKLNDYQGAFGAFNDSDMPLIHQEEPWQKGDSIILLGYAETLSRIRDEKRNGFYNGETARLLLEEIQSGNGIISQSDLDNYHSEWVEVLAGNYKGYSIISMPPPSSGGIALLQLLEGAEAYNLKDLGHNSSKYIHILTELERRVYADRATHLGDPNFFNVPKHILLDSNYIASRNASINLDVKTPSESIKEGQVSHIESVETTHFSILDKFHNAVAITTTLNGNYGSKVMVDEAQFFLNNEMDDFSIKPGVPNMYGLVGGEANAISPGKRMLSSMTPTIVLRNDSIHMILGTPGGSTIITSVFQNILNVIEFEMTMSESIAQGRVHHQWLPDMILFEEGRLDSLTIKELEGIGHVLESRPAIGRVDAILQESSPCLEGAADQRGDDFSKGY